MKSATNDRKCLLETVMKRSETLRKVMVNGLERSYCTRSWSETFTKSRFTKNERLTLPYLITESIAITNGYIYKFYYSTLIDVLQIGHTSLISVHFQIYDSSVIERLPLPSRNITFSSFTTFFTFGTNCF